eukprot:6479929-Amphidinium_carterae.1
MDDDADDPHEELLDDVMLCYSPPDSDADTLALDVAAAADAAVESDAASAAESAESRVVPVLLEGQTRLHFATVCGDSGPLAHHHDAGGGDIVPDA